MRRDYSTDSVEFHDLYCLGSVTLYAKVILVQLAKQSEWKEVKFVYLGRMTSCEAQKVGGAGTGPIAGPGPAPKKTGCALLILVTQLTVVPLTSDEVNDVQESKYSKVIPAQENIGNGTYLVFTRGLYMNIDNEAWDLVRLTR